MRDLEFSVSREVSLLSVFRAMFSLLAPGRPLPETPRREVERKYNWGIDESYFTVEGDGVLIAEECFGAVPGDGINSVYHLTVGDEILIHVAQGHDYLQSTYVFRVRGTAETIDVATDALLQAALAGGLAFLRRNDTPGPVPWPSTP